MSVCNRALHSSNNIASCYRHHLLVIRLARSAPLHCRDTHEEYEQKGYVFRLTNQSVDEASITDITTLSVRRGDAVLSPIRIFWAYLLRHDRSCCCVPF